MSSWTGETFTGETFNGLGLFPRIEPGSRERRSRKPGSDVSASSDLEVVRNPVQIVSPF
jgi:hypothetical protein